MVPWHHFSSPQLLVLWSATWGHVSCLQNSKTEQYQDICDHSWSWPGACSNMFQQTKTSWTAEKHQFLFRICLELAWTCQIQKFPALPNRKALACRASPARVRLSNPAGATPRCIRTKRLCQQQQGSETGVWFPCITAVPHHTPPPCVHTYQFYTFQICIPDRFCIDLCWFSTFVIILLPICQLVWMIAITWIHFQDVKEWRDRTTTRMIVHSPWSLFNVKQTRSNTILCTD